MENLPPEGHDAYELSTVERALREAFKSADDYVTRQTPYCNEGSCAVSVTVHCDREGKASIISCNVGDSRLEICGRIASGFSVHRPVAGGFRLRGYIRWGRRGSVRNAVSLACRFYVT